MEAPVGNVDPDGQRWRAHKCALQTRKVATLSADGHADYFGVQDLLE